ncbi:MAG: hypothetical protein IPK82_20845 [Polyangiaceae bacterium]|nr:hypothetical protein [Polyangiaceae bacterium]
MKTTPIVISALAIACGLSAAACDSRPDTLTPKPHSPYQENPTNNVEEKPGAFAGGQDNTFDHMAGLGDDAPKDAFEVLQQREEEGPAEIRTRLHSCQKIQVTTLRNMLSSLGVNLDATGNPPTAGQLLKEGTGALGAANYDARVGETIVWTAAGAAKLFDIFVQAAPEIIANLPNMPQCQIDGVGVQLFDENNVCVADGITCIIGRPATPEHVAICNSVVNNASSIENGKNIAVATILSAAHSCE